MSLCRAFIGLGSNLSEPADRIREALQRLQLVSGIERLDCSPLYRSPPWGEPDQPWYVNAVADVWCALSAQQLLAALLGIEQSMGRVRGKRWGARIIDLDLLWHDGQVIDQPGLRLPHPHLGDRAFVLRPWADLAPECVVPGLGAVADLLEKVDCSSLEPLT